MVLLILLMFKQLAVMDLALILSPQTQLLQQHQHHLHSVLRSLSVKVAPQDFTDIMEGIQYFVLEVMFIITINQNVALIILWVRARRVRIQIDYVE